MDCPEDLSGLESFVHTAVLNLRPHRGFWLGAQPYWTEIAFLFMSMTCLRSLNLIFLPPLTQKQLHKHILDVLSCQLKLDPLEASLGDNLLPLAVAPLPNPKLVDLVPDSR